MHLTILSTSLSSATLFAIFLETAPSVLVATYVAAIALLLVGIWGAKDDVAQARGLEKVVALRYLCFAMPLAVFSAQHFFDSKSIAQLVPSYFPWPLFWTYFVGVCMFAASLSMATKIQVRWSGLLFGIMMFLFDSMMALPATIADPHNRFNWVLLAREMSFGSGAWALSAGAPDGWGPRAKDTFITIARVIIGMAAMLYGVEHFLHPDNVPGVPLEKLMPAWIPGHAVISYLTGAILVGAGVSILLAKRTRMTATCLGSWILLLVVFVYGPILVAALMDPSGTVKLEGMNYFFDTLLYGAVMLALGGASGPEA